MKQERFPFVADDEIILTEMPVMDLYDESDLISNIEGDYQDKNYLDWSSIAKKEAPSQTAPRQEVVKKAEKTYAEQAREEARADLRKKRSASYLTQDAPHSRRQTSRLSKRQEQQPTAPFQKENPGELAKYSKKLSQSHYILLESLEEKPAPVKEQKGKPKKNNYDFLKKSQIYNKQSRQTEQERQVAQELNLTRMSD